MDGNKEIEKEQQEDELDTLDDDCGHSKGPPGWGRPRVWDKNSESLAGGFRESIPGAALGPSLGLQQEF